MNLDKKKDYQEKTGYTHFYSKEVDGVIYRLEKDFGGYVAHKIKSENDSANVNIKSEIDGIPVKKVDSYLISENEKVEYLKVPDSVEEFFIGNLCKHFRLKTIELPKGLKVFRYTSFDDIKDIEIKGNCDIIPEEFTWDANKEINRKRTFLKVLNKDGKCVGVTWHGEYIRSDGKKSIKYINFIKKDRTISLEAEKKYLKDNKIAFDENDLFYFNKIIKIIYPKLDDIPLPVPDFGKLFVNFKEWKDFGLDIYTIYDNSKIIFKNHSEMFDNIYENYSFLCSQNNITSSKMLQKIYFGFEFDSKEEFAKKLENSIKYRGKFELNTLIKLMDDSEDNIVKQKLKDSLIYASTIVPLNVDNIDSMNMLELRDIIAHDVFENIAKLNDESYIDSYGLSLKKYPLSENDEDLFKGVHYHIRKDLEKINPNFYRGNIINLSDSEVFDFLKTLNTIKNWDKLSNDKKKRAILLKNEVIGRVLYATLRTAIESDNSNKNIKKFLSDVDFYNLDLSACKDLFMKCLFYTGFKNDKKEDLERKIDIAVINKMITLNPYTFDMLRDGREINKSFYKTAFDNNYLFREQEDLNIINSMMKELQKQNPFSAVAQYMLNDIENNPESNKFNVTFALNIRRMLDEYFYSNSSEDNEFLFNIFRGIDVYLRKKFSIDSQEIANRNVKGLSKEMFDANVRKLSDEIFDLTCQDKYNNYDRLCYSLFNLNRLAHDVHNISMKELEFDFNKYRNSFSETVKLNKILKSYEELSRFGLMPKDMNFLFENNKRFVKMIMDENFPVNQKTLLLNSILPETIKEINNDNIDGIVKCFEGIMNVDDNVRNRIELDAEEQRMNYDAKKVVGEIFVRMLSEFASNSLDNQKEFFKKYGFVIECQHDAKEEGNDLLVVYNPKFGNTFSVHMIDMDDDIKSVFDVHRKNDQKRALCCSEIKGGLVEFEQAIIEDGKELIEFSSSGYVNTKKYKDKNLLNASIQFHNFLEYDCEVYKEKIANAKGNQEELKNIILDIFKKIPIKNFDEVNIRKDNGNNTYLSTGILSLISDKIGIRLDTAVNIVNSSMIQDENSFTKFGDKYAILVVKCLERLYEKFLITDANYQKSKYFNFDCQENCLNDFYNQSNGADDSNDSKETLDDMISESFPTNTDVVSGNKHI